MADADEPDEESDDAAPAEPVGATVATANTVPIRRCRDQSPVSELERCCSADPSRTHGMAISIAAATAIQRQWTSTARRSTRHRRQREQDRRRDGRPQEDQGGGRDLGHRDPDEQVRDAPDDAIDANRISPRLVIAAPPIASPTHLSRHRRVSRAPDPATSCRRGRTRGGIERLRRASVGFAGPGSGPARRLRPSPVRKITTPKIRMTGTQIARSVLPAPMTPS
jgi:hypothetical protein